MEDAADYHHSAKTQELQLRHLDTLGMYSFKHVDVDRKRSLNVQTPTFAESTIPVLFALAVTEWISSKQKRDQDS